MGEKLAAVFSIESRDKDNKIRFDFTVYQEVCVKRNKTHFYFQVTIIKKGSDSTTFRREIGSLEVDKFKHKISNRGYLKNKYRDLSGYIQNLDCYGLSCKCQRLTPTKPAPSEPIETCLEKSSEPPSFEEAWEDLLACSPSNFHPSLGSEDTIQKKLDSCEEYIWDFDLEELN